MHASSQASSPPQYALTVDLSNAFNTISRESVHASLARFIPSLIPWFLATHSTPATLYIPDSPPILSREGVQQGDPLGPVFFALGIHGAIVDWTARHPSVWSSWYLDDGILWGTATDLNNALTDLQEAFACLGLRLNTNKSFLFSKHDTPIPRNLAGLAPLQLVPFSSGLTILGSPVGAPHSILHFLHSKLLSMRDMLSSLPSLQHPQAALILLRASLGVCRITHLLRSIPPSSLGPFISDLSALLHTTLEAVLSFPLDERSWAQASLPLSLGGLGVTDPRAIAHAAYLSSSFSFILAPPKFGPTPSNPAPVEAMEAARGLLQLLDAAVLRQHLPLREWIDRGHVSIPASSPAAPTLGQLSSQQWWSSWVHLSAFRALLSSSGPRDRARLQLLRTPHSAAWLAVHPNPALHTELSPRAFSLAVARRLGLPIVGPAVTSRPCPTCGLTVDAFGDHLLSCQNVSKHERHNALRDVLALLAHEIGTPCQKEVTMTGKERPADLLFSSLFTAGPTAVDITMVTPFPAASSSPFNAADPSHATAAAEARKQAKYAHLFPSPSPGRTQFLPAAFDCLGGRGQGASKLVTAVAAALAATAGEPRDSSALALRVWGLVTLTLQASCSNILSALIPPSQTFCPPLPPLLRPHPPPYIGIFRLSPPRHPPYHKPPSSPHHISPTFPSSAQHTPNFFYAPSIYTFGIASNIPTSAPSPAFNLSKSSQTPAAHVSSLRFSVHSWHPHFATASFLTSSLTAAFRHFNTHAFTL